MAKRPYIKEINPNTPDSHQVSPAYMLTVLRFSNRDTHNYEGDNLETRRPLVIYNDAISVAVTNTKKGVTSSLVASLLAGDINYATAINPGDYVICNMVDWNDKVSVVDNRGNEVNPNSLRAKVAANKPINTYNDGFKGLFRVQKVDKVLRTDPATGRKVFYFEMTAFGFTEFNTKVYYDPQIFNQLQGNFRFFMQQFDNWFGNTVSKKENNKVHNIMPMLVSALIGQGNKKQTFKIQQPQITHFRIPDSLGPLLGLKSVKYAADLYNYYVGVWASSVSGTTNPARGFNPSMKINPDAAAGFYETGIDLQGRKVIEAEYWNNVKVWNILSKYSNTLINEMYTTYRVNPQGRVMPSLVIRQKPFTSNHYQSPQEIKSKFATPINKTPTTKYFELPRWKLNPNLVYDMRLGKDEAARINFVQVYTRTVAANDQRNRARQTGTGNYQFDVGDIERSGLKPYLATADFDYPENGDKSTKGKEWANLVSDWVINGQLRESGTLSCQGIQDPISVGDNLEFDGIIYHIEQVQHRISINPSNGKKTFRTNLVLSFGTDPRSDASRPVYSEMEHTDRYTLQKEDYNDGERILPGFSDSQDIVGRRDGEELRETRQQSFTLNPKKKKKEDNSPVTGENSSKQESDRMSTEDPSAGNLLDPSKILDDLF